MTDVLPEAPPGTEAPPPLAGYTVAVTAARRREELGALLARRGARVVYAPAIRIVPLADDAELVDDLDGSADYKRHLIRVFLRQAYADATDGAAA